MKRTRAQKLLTELRGRRVLVLGDIMLDEFTWGRARRIAPEAPVPVVEVERETRHLGGAANVGANILNLGGIPLVVGVTGTDTSREILKTEFEKLGLEACGLVADASRPTTVKTRVIAHSQQVVRVDRENRSPVNAQIEQDLIETALEFLDEVDAVVISDYDKGVLTPGLLQAVLPQARRQDLPVCLDPKLRNFPFYKPVTVITPNHHEAEAITRRTIESEETLIEIGHEVRRMLDFPNVLITRGEEGMSLFAASGDLTHIPTVAREVYDVTGAGDTVVATLALALAAGASMLEAAILSNHAAGVVVGKVGTATAKPQEVLASFS